MKARQYTPKVIKAIWDYVKKYGYVCYYTGIPLDMANPKSPWFCVFDHWAPHDPNKIVITSALINGMKTDLSEREFWSIIRALANFKRKHIQFRKRKLRYWDHHYTLPDDRMIHASQMPGRGTGFCDLCGKKLKSKMYTYCSVCVKIAIRLRQDHKRLPPETVEDTFNYIRKNGFVCFYTGMRLDLTDPPSPWYCVFNHWKPRDKGKIVLTSALINVMKLDLTEDEFWYYIKALADYKEKGKPIRKKWPQFWFRLYPVEDK